MTTKTKRTGADDPMSQLTKVYRERRLKIDRVQKAEQAVIRAAQKFALELGTPGEGDSDIDRVVACHDKLGRALARLDKATGRKP